MQYKEQITLKNGQTAILRNGLASDGAAVLANFNLTHEETDFLLTYPEESTQNYLMGAALCLIAYLGIRRLDDKNKEKIEHLSALLKAFHHHSRSRRREPLPRRPAPSF